LRDVHRRRPAQPLVRAKLAKALLRDDEFDELIALLEPPSESDHALSLLLIQAHLARETSEDDRRVVEIADRSLADAQADPMRAQLLADRAKAVRRLGDFAAARGSLDRALALDPTNKDACKRLASLDLQMSEGDGIAVFDRLAARGASHSRLHAARAVAHAVAGRIEEARDLIGIDRLGYAETIDTPEGMPDLAAFNVALAAELLAHPDLRYNRYGTASEQTWRIDVPALGDAPMVRMLLAEIARTAERHVDRLSPIDHPWLRARPAAGLLHCWSVLTDGEGFETWHVHQFGWMSGVYYVQVPPSIGVGDDPAGCIAFGLPEDVVGSDAASRYGMQVVRPREGLLMLFPSHSYHRTFPHGAAERRICVAFDIWPA